MGETGELDYRPCSVCGDEGMYFCRMCSVAYCCEHLCLHLSVAWEENSWTKRNSQEEECSDEREEISNGNVADYGNVLPERYPNQPVTSRHSSLFSNEKALPSYSETQLKSALEFYRGQARRINRELERRALPLAGSFPIEQGQLLARKPVKHRVTKRCGVTKIPKPIQNAFEVFANLMRTGRITPDELKAILLKNVDSAPRKVYDNSDVPF